MLERLDFRLSGDVISAKLLASSLRVVQIMVMDRTGCRVMGGRKFTHDFAATDDSNEKRKQPAPQRN